MKESFNDILHEGIVAKATSTFHGLVLGVKNLFRHGTPAPGLENAAGNESNNHLKTADEIDAEFMRLAKEGLEIAETEKASTPNYRTLDMTASHTEVFLQNEQLPEYMEENY